MTRVLSLKNILVLQKNRFFHVDLKDKLLIFQCHGDRCLSSNLQEHFTDLKKLVNGKSLLMGEKNVQKRLIRLGQILRVFLDKDRVSSIWLSRNFQITPRTIQRDLAALKKSGFPIHEIQKGVYRLGKDLIKNLEVFDETELALVITLRNVVGQLGRPFQKAADGLFNSLYDAASSMPVYVRMDESIPLDSSLLNRIVKSIRLKKIAGFYYKSGKPHQVNMEPYRVVHFGGFWYLVGKDTGDSVIKRYALDRISDFKMGRTSFRKIPENLDSAIQGSANIWFSTDQNLVVKISVDASSSGYFKRRKVFPTQEITEEREDGSLIVTFRVGRYEAIQDILKSWLPHITILEPTEFRDAFLADMKKWVQRQEKTMMQGDLDAKSSEAK